MAPTHHRPIVALPCGMGILQFSVFVAGAIMSCHYTHSAAEDRSRSVSNPTRPTTTSAPELPDMHSMTSMGMTTDPIQVTKL